MDEVCHKRSRYHTKNHLKKNTEDPFAGLSQEVLPLFSTSKMTGKQKEGLI